MDAGLLAVIMWGKINVNSYQWMPDFNHTSLHIPSGASGAGIIHITTLFKLKFVYESV